MTKYCDKCFMPEEDCQCQQCSQCKGIFPPNELYEHRGIIACGDCIETAREQREQDRQEIIEENHHKTDKFRGLDLGDNQIGRANSEILKADIEVAKKESARRKSYEGANP